ncbi:hypothetical protein AXE65_03345 [Ventosimonas gracilis]|uniref:Exclusion suppressor FxsA n=1 Tax=Ventosimonas gracilis TaxID=1680762 RepID=A0A139SRT1_9GAMM|nr:FxsA family protein [Ventosimonas gracilis]KXU37253.1 hypothetical protein AXE65_03345 [Ventosimonas gracilis]
MRIFLPFLLFSLLELFLLIRFAAWLGVWFCLFFLLAKALLASLLLRRLGRAVIEQMRGLLSRGQSPLALMSDGLLMGAGSILLMLPGFISDCLGLACLLPAVRRLLLARFARQPAASQIIEGEFEEVASDKLPLAAPDEKIF